MKKFVVMCALALAVATILSVTFRPVPIEQKLIQIQTQDLLNDFPDITNQPLNVRAVLLDLADEPLLITKAKAAFIRYPNMAPSIFALYGHEPEFQDILRRHGEVVLPPINYFHSQPIYSIEFINQADQRYQAFKQLMSNIPKNTDESDTTNRYQSLSAQQRGRYAINFIHAEGHDFLGQFLVDEQGDTQWLNIERILEGTNQIFTSGINSLEKKYRVGEDITAADVGWASLDILILSGAVKALNIGRRAAATTKNVSRGTAVTTKNAGLASRSATFTARLSKSGRLVLKSARYAKWPTIISAGYLVIKHPSVINDVLAGLANALGYPVLLIQLLGWFLLLLPLLYLSRWLLWILSPLLMGILRSTLWLIVKMSGRKEQYF